MITPKQEAEVIRLFCVDHWPVRAIASQLRIYRITVKRVLAQAGTLRVERLAHRSSSSTQRGRS